MAPLQPQNSTAPQPQGDQLQIQHFTHPHLLQKLFTASEFNCNGCKTRGQGIRYRCSACNFDLHEQCATAPHHLSSHLHPQHQLSLVNRPGNSHFCDVCKGFTDGLSYTCQMCGFDVHPLCVQIPTGVRSATLNPCQQQGGMTWGQPTTAVGGYNHGRDNNSHPVMMNLQQQQGQGIPYGVNNTQPMTMMMNQQHQGVPTTGFGGFNGVNNNSKPVMMNQLQQQQGTSSFGGYQGVNNSQQQQHVMMMNSQQGSFGGYNNNHPVMMMMNNHQQQQGMPTMMVNHHHHQQQQHPAMATTAFSGYNGVNNNQAMNMMMMNQQQQQQQVPARSNSLSKVGKLAANVLMTSLIGVPINFNSKN